MNRSIHPMAVPTSHEPKGSVAVRGRPPSGAGPLLAAIVCLTVIFGCGLTRFAEPPPPETTRAQEADEHGADPSETAAANEIDPRKGTPEELFINCLPKPEESVLELEVALDRAMEARDTRCWTVIEIALAHALLDDASSLPTEARDRQIKLAGYRFRQAELRAGRYAFDELAAVSHRGRARMAMRRADRDSVLEHLDHAVLAAGLHTASSGEAPLILDEIFIQKIIETLAAWEHRGDHALVAAAFESASQLKAREALRAFRAEQVTTESMARVVGAEPATAIGGLLAWSERAMKTYGRQNRIDGQRRIVAAETVLQSGSAWAASAPFMLGWLPASMPEILTGLQAVFGSGEVLLDYSVGNEHGALLALSETGFVARPIPGRAGLEKMIQACREGDCLDFDRAILEPAAELLADAKQVLVAAHGPLHDAPFEERLEPRLMRVPSALGLTILRLREWQAGPRSHPDAAGLVEGALPPAREAVDEPTGDRPDPVPSRPSAPTENEQTDVESPEEATVVSEITEAGEAKEEDTEDDHPADSMQTEPMMAAQPVWPRIEAPGDSRALARIWASLAAGSHLLEWEVEGHEEVRWYGAPLTVPR